MSMIKYDITPLNEDGTAPSKKNADDSLELDPEKIEEAKRSHNRVKELIWA